MSLSKIFGERMTFQNISQFMIKIYRWDKLIEIISFLVWEIKYQLNFYRKSQKLKFTNKNPLSFLGQNKIQQKLKSSTFEISQSEEDWALVYIDSSKYYWGCMFENQSTLCQFSPEGEMINSYKFPDKITGLYANQTGDIFCCVNGILYKSTNNNKSFKEVLKLSTPHSSFRKDAFTETPTGNLLIGEYANILENKKWKFVGYIYYSIDNGDNWIKTNFLRRAGVNKHIHILKWSDVVNGLIMTDGDNQKNIWINRSNTHYDEISSTPELGWKKINKYHIQKGGYTGIAELNDKLIFGTDYQGGTNFLITTKDMINFNEEIVPSPFRRAIFNRIVVRINKKNEHEVWAILKFKFNKKTKNLLMVSTDNMKTWKKVIKYDGTQHKINIISASRDLSEEIYLLVKNKNKDITKIMYIHS